MNPPAKSNYKLLFFNVQTIGLSGRNQTVLFGVSKTPEVVRSCAHIKMLMGDYPCAAIIVSCTPSKAASPCVPAPAEDLDHVLTITICRATADLLNTITSYFLTTPGRVC